MQQPHAYLHHVLCGNPTVHPTAETALKKLITTVCPGTPYSNQEQYTLCTACDNTAVKGMLITRLCRPHHLPRLVFQQKFPLVSPPPLLLASRRSSSATTMAQPQRRISTCSRPTYLHATMTRCLCSCKRTALTTSASS